MSCLSWASLSAVPPPLAIADVDLVDVSEGKVIRRVLLVMKGGQVSYVGPYRESVIPYGARLLRLPGRTVIPGLIDLHVHVNSPLIARLLLAAGVTTAREMGSPQKSLFQIKQKIEGELLPGPDLVPWAPVAEEAGPPFAFRVQSVDQIKNLFATFSAAGYSGIKIFDLRPSHLAPALTAARESGLRVSFHTDRVSPLSAIEGGAASLEHVFFVFADKLAEPFAPSLTATLLQYWASLDLESEAVDEVIRRLKCSGTALVPTLSVLEALLWPDRLPAIQPALASLPAALAAPLRDQLGHSSFSAGWHDSDRAAAGRAWNHILTFVGKAYRAGVPILTGSDNVIPGFGIQREIALLVEAGLTPVEALQSATLDGAVFLGTAARGSVQRGKRADLLVLKGNPLEEIDQLAGIEYVVRAGRLFEPLSLLEDR